MQEKRSKLATFLNLRNIALEDFAKICQVHRSHASKIKAGMVRPALETARRIYDAYSPEISLEDILYDPIYKKQKKSGPKSKVLNE